MEENKPAESKEAILPEAATIIRGRIDKIYGRGISNQDHRLNCISIAELTWSLHSAILRKERDYWKALAEAAEQLIISVEQYGEYSTKDYEKWNDDKQNPQEFPEKIYKKRSS